MSKFDYKVAQEVATTEVKDAVEYFTMKEHNEADITERYADTIQAVRFGKLIFDEQKKPMYELMEPIKNDAGDVVLDKIEFRTRITVSDQKRLASGLNLKKDSFEMGIRCMAHIIGQPVNMLDKLGRFDYKVIENLSALFL